MWLVSKITGFIKNETKENSAKGLVVFTKEVIENSTYGEFYTVPICPKCKHILDEIKARYDAKCCYLCGYQNGGLFYTKNVVVRDRFVDGKFIETVCQ